MEHLDNVLKATGENVLEGAGKISHAQAMASLMPQDYEKYNVPLFFGIWAVISLILVFIGIIPLLLGKYSKKYRIWVEKEVKSYQKWMLKKIEKSIEKEE